MKEHENTRKEFMNTALLSTSSPSLPCSQEHRSRKQSLFRSDLGLKSNKNMSYYSSGLLGSFRTYINVEGISTAHCNRGFPRLVGGTDASRQQHSAQRPKAASPFFTRDT
jgi:hypothetical protein